MTAAPDPTALVAEFQDFARYLRNPPANPLTEKREVSVAMILAVADALAASPTPPIPMIAEAGERERARMAAFTAIAGENPDPFLMPESYEHACAVADAVLAALSTPATLDNTAVEGQEARVSVTEALVEVGFCASISEAARLVRGGGAYVNGIPADGAITRVSPGDTVSAGKKHNAVFRATLTAKMEKAEPIDLLPVTPEIEARLA